mmetsp:Transcript_24966/g.21838  ORF Transcript_24966/g.21838 Transcript_24966/m.21838 type:complete len:152 (-) Transcript_24966:19-474(-)
MGNGPPYSGSSKVYIHNKTGDKYKLTVRHQYTGKSTQDSGWKTVEADEKVYMLTANFNYGFLTTGRSNWIIEGKRQWGLISDVGKVEIEQRRSGSGAGAEWKCHTLANTDDGCSTNIYVYASNIEIISYSGKSETSFNVKNSLSGPGWPLW